MIHKSFFKRLGSPLPGFASPVIHPFWVIAVVLVEFCSWPSLLLGGEHQSGMRGSCSPSHWFAGRWFSQHSSFPWLIQSFFIIWALSVEIWVSLWKGWSGSTTGWDISSRCGTFWGLYICRLLPHIVLSLLLLTVMVWGFGFSFSHDHVSQVSIWKVNLSVFPHLLYSTWLQQMGPN